MKPLIEWSELAEEDIANSLAYLVGKWGNSAALNFLDRLEEAIQGVQANPTSFLQVEKQKHIHKFVLNKHVTLYYQIHKDIVYLITFWQNKKDDNKLRDIIDSQ